MLRAALADRAGRRFFAAHAQSCLGTGLAYVALPLLAYDRFGTAWAVAAVLAPDLLPAVVLGPLLGALVDRVGWQACAALADLVRCVAFVGLLSAHSLPLMIAAACLAGVGTAMFAPSALAGLSRLSPALRRPAAMGLFGALDDLGLTVGPALAGLLLAVTAPAALMGVNAATFAISALLLLTLRPAREGGTPAARPRRSLLSEARAGIRALAGRADIRTLLGSSTATVFCVGVTNVGEVVLARSVFGVGGSGLAALMTAGGVGTVLGSLAARFEQPWQWRRAYLVGLTCMGGELLGCGLLPSFWLVLPMFAVGGFGNGLALVHDRLLLSHAAEESLHGRLFALQKTCTSLAFAGSFALAGLVIGLGGVRVAFLCSCLGLLTVMAVAIPRLRAAWPTPPAAARVPAPTA